MVSRTWYEVGMRAIFRERPPWLVRVDVDRAPVGAGTLISPDLVLTCSHVVPADHAEVVLVHAGRTSAAAVEFRADHRRRRR